MTSVHFLMTWLMRDSIRRLGNLIHIAVLLFRKIQSIGTVRFQQTVQTLIRLLLKEQSHQGPTLFASTSLHILDHRCIRKEISLLLG